MDNERRIPRETIDVYHVEHRHMMLPNDLFIGAAIRILRCVVFSIHRIHQRLPPYPGQEWIQDNTSSARVVLSLIPQQHRHVNSRHLWSDWLVLLSSKRAILCDEMTTRV